MTRITIKLAVLTALTLPAAAQELAPTPPVRPEPPPVFKLIEPAPAVADCDTLGAAALFATLGVAEAAAPSSMIAST